MTKRPETQHSPAGELSHGQAQIAFSSGGDSPARPAILVELDGASITVRYFDNSTDTFSVFKADRLAAVFARKDLCRFREQPFLLVNRLCCTQGNLPWLLRWNILRYPWIYLLGWKGVALGEG